MHDTIIARKIIEEAESHGIVKKIHLEIGEIASVPAKELVACLETITNWRITCKEIVSIVRCKCGYNGRVKIIERGHDFCLIECPECQSLPEIASGNEIKLIRVVVD